MRLPRAAARSRAPQSAKLPPSADGKISAQLGRTADATRVLRKTAAEKRAYASAQFTVRKNTPGENAQHYYYTKSHAAGKESNYQNARLYIVQSASENIEKNA